MMKMYVALAASVVGLSVLSGCGKEEAAPTPPPAAPTPSVNTSTTAQQLSADANKATAAAAEQAKSASAALTAEAQKLLTEATTYIKDKKFDLADKAVNRLTEMKPQLPAEYGPRIDQLRSALEAAKAANSFKLPGAK